MPATPSNGGDIILWCLALMGAIALLGGLVWLVRWWTLGKDTPRASEPWTLQELREMRAAGQVTEEEFQVLKRQILRAANPATGSPEEGEAREPK